LISTQFTDLTPRLGQANTNWIDEVTQVGQGMKHSVSFTDNNFFMSVMNQKLNGVVRHDQLDIYNFSINYGKKFLKDVVELNISVKNGFTKNNFGDNQIGAATDFNPTQPVYDPASIFGGYFEPQNIGELGVQNPVARQDLVTNTGRSFRSLGKAELIINVPFVEGLSFTNNLSYDVSSSKNRYFQPKNLFGAYGRGFLNYDEGAKETYLYETFANYKKQLSSDQLVEITAGYSFQTFSTEGSYFAMDSLVSDLSTIYDPSVAKVIRPGAWYNIKYQQSYFGRVNYSLKDKYLVTANARYDGSSQFGPENRYGFFPSVALGWRLIDEDFMGFARNTFDELKIRASYGVLGNQNFAPYLYENFYYLGTIDARYQFGSDFVNTLRPTPVDKGIKWEVSNTLNIGLDYDLVGGRINGSLEYYERMTKDLLFDPIFPVGTAVGFRYISNIGVMKNKGVELQVSAVVVDKSDYSWNISFNAAHNSNEILRIDNSALGGVEAVPSGGISGDVGQTIQVIQVGYPINTFSVYEHKYEGGLPVKDRLTGSRTDMYVDQNNDDIINEDDRVPFESANPDFEFGLTSHARYKNFDLSFTLRSRIGNYVYNNVASSKGFKNRVKELGGPYNIHTSALVTNFSTKQLFSDYYVENASFVRMDNITLSYNIDALKFAKIRLYTTAQNLFTLTNYSGLDPEIGNGIDNSLYPRALQLVGGINVNF
ncbi:MAG: SusC/RagA family TonB-linked outer membrane protein, partial [Cyclobacteriaceae bacterium]|nr:SusC/RagA family TonB-linked outer membrane protein [Cyclobacteriaceae bacterium]